MDKLERQMGLLATLLHTDRPLRAAEIRAHVEGYPDDKVAFRRAFERDKDDLRRLGIPLEVSPTQTSDGPVDGYRVVKSEYYLHDLALEPDETVALSMALRLIRLEGAEAQDALWKLGGSVDAPVDAQPELAAIAIGPAVTQIYQAIADSSVVQFEYRETTRTVEPWRLAFRRGHWYLHGWDRDREDTRQFRLDRIEGGVHIDETVTATQQRLTPEGERQPWEFATDDATDFTARVAVDASQAAWVRHHLGADAVVADRPDGGVEIELDVANVSAFRSLVLSLHDAAEVLSPPQAREDIVAWLQAQTV